MGAGGTLRAAEDDVGTGGGDSRPTGTLLPATRFAPPAPEGTLILAGWGVTGVAAGPGGAGVGQLPLKTDSGESRGLAAGETLQGLVLVGVRGSGGPG